MLRLLTKRILRYGEFCLRKNCTKRSYVNILERKRSRVPANVRKAGTEGYVKARLTSEGFRFRHYVRRLLPNNFFSRATSSGNLHFRNRTVREILNGSTGPSFCLVGVTFGSAGATLLSKEDELEAFCLEIREAALYLQDKLSANDEIQKTTNEIGLEDLNVGPPIAKGCTAVVYAAAFKEKEFEREQIDNNENFDFRIYLNKCFKFANIRSNVSEIMAIVRTYNRFLKNFGSNNVITREDVNSEKKITKSLDSVDVEFIEDGLRMEKQQMTDVSMSRYPLALKMMFNYDIQSNAQAILNVMGRELVPVQRSSRCGAVQNWMTTLQNTSLELPPHPNVVFMFNAFCAQIPDLHEARALYPMALPARLNPDGFGRNMSLFLLMKRYSSSLRDYLNNCDVEPAVRLLLFAELLEGVCHLARHGVAHRDIKSDNILVDLYCQESSPILVISDFGCCLADQYHGLKIPYTSEYIDKGGNTALMAPEIVKKTAGPFSVLDYTKSDLWACGTIAYEIFGQSNPFYGENENSSQPPLRNTDYTQADLPVLNSNCPVLIKKLINNILNPNPKKRMRAEVAANVMQLYLWAPSNWLKPDGMPSTAEILQWLLTLTAKLMCEGKFGSSFGKTSQMKNTEFILISSFLVRARLRGIRSALSWIQSVV